MSDSVDTPAEAIDPVEPAAPAPAQPKGSAVWREIKGLALVLLAVLAFHSFIAKPFYIPSESMMPVLLKGDRLVVTKYPYGWSWVSPSFHILPHWSGRLLGHMPQRGDVVIVTPPGRSDDYIKRVIGLPGDTIEVKGGRVILNGQPLKAEIRPPAMVAVDANAPCAVDQFPGDLVVLGDGRSFCRLPIVRETLPGGRTYDTIDLGQSPGDDYGPETIPPDHVFLMGDNRDRSADSRFSLAQDGLGGPVPWENLGGRAEFLTFSLDGNASWLNPISWFQSLRGGRAGSSLHPATAH
ncbi:signal peptidase I [Sphingomonas sp.]|uniref:signal peptidase I n=1 Tax=Sphingomonas sp. TaxID=28214 RepID=UPI00286C739A|nr:signal peptidase I [Sphingomonas sp.]